MTKEHKNESFLVSFKGRVSDYCTQCSFRICPEKVSTYFALPIVHFGKYKEDRWNRYWEAQIKSAKGKITKISQTGQVVFWSF